MGAGDCYPAAFKAINSSKFFTKDHEPNHDWVVVHALRDILPGAEHYGGHAFLLNKKTKTVYDSSISAKYIDGSVDGVVDGMPLDEYVEKTFLLTEGKYVWKEYTLKELNEITFEHMVHTPFDLAKEQWSLASKDEEFAKRFPGFSSYKEYMQEYFIPTFCPTQHEHNKKNKKHVTKLEKVESNK
mgnify:FL=1